MSNGLSIFIVIGGGAVVGLIMAFILRRQGYSFLSSFVKGLLAGATILGIIVKIIRDYL